MSVRVKRHYVRKKRKAGSLKWLMHILIVLLIIVSVYFFMRSSFFAVSSIVVSGTKNVTESNIIELSGLAKGENIFEVDQEKAQERVLAHAMVKNVEIEKKLPASIKIMIEERIPAALVPVTGGFLCIDEQGYILKKQTIFNGQALSIITGISVPVDAGVGNKIESDKLQMGLSMVGQMTEKAREMITEIDVSDTQKLKAYTVQGSEVRFGDASGFQEKFERFLQVMNEQGKKDRLDDIKYIDVSFPGKPVIFYRK